MDKYYGNVCELDIIFNFQKAYFILDELLLAGEMQESSKKNVLRCIGQQDSLEDMEVRSLVSFFCRPRVARSSFRPERLTWLTSLSVSSGRGRCYEDHVKRSHGSTGVRELEVKEFWNVEIRIPNTVANLSISGLLC